MQIGEQYVKDGYFVSMDLLGENVATKEEAEKETCAYIEMAERIAVSPQRDQMNISIKLTALGMDISDEIASENYRRILDVCKPHNIFVRADMEASPYTQRTIDIVEKLFATYKNCGTVLQSYLHRTPSDVQKMIGLGARVRIVKGAYLEPETVAYQSKAKVDEMYLEAAKALLLEGNYPAIATHDINMIEPLKKFIKDNNIPKERYEWQMIYGVRRDLQEQLLKEGYNIRIYIPFGAAWYPYFSRRLAERPANMLFILKSLFKK
jgi:proline dehydrogenase